MSGIAAVVSLDGSEISRSDIERMANVLKPHGPDRQKIMTRGKAAFIFCLHELTPEDRFESQPLTLGDQIVMLFDGRIDNRSELGETLGISTNELHSMPDSQLALNLFERWGEGAFNRILGVFAIIIMDLRDGHVLCARDQMGLRVLHYHQSTDRFSVSTTPQALFALSWVSRNLNRDKVGDTLVQRGLNGETTYYRDIYRVLPGCTVRVRGTSISKTRFWDPANIPDVRFNNDQEYVDAFKERFNASVKACLRSIRTPCATLTGGLDSSSIAVIAADMLASTGKCLDTFTAVPEAGFSREELRGRYFDEAGYCRQIAKANGNIAPHFIPPSKTPILQQIAREIQLGGFSGGILNGLWVMDILAAARSAGHNVMLSGEMGNFTMSYHGRGLFTELLLRGRWLKLFREIKASGDRWKDRVRQYMFAPLVPPPLYRRYRQWRRAGNPPWYDFSMIHPQFAQESGVLDRAACEYMPFDTTQPREFKLSRINDLHCYAETADWYANIRAGFGVDFRTPAFDRRLVEFCIGIPQDQYLQGGRERWLIRRAMKGRLPEGVLNNKKFGAQAADWYTRLSRERKLLVEEIKRLATNSEVSSIVDIQRMNSILENWPDRQPSEYTSQERRMLAVPEAVGAAYFIENMTGTNFGR